MPSHYWCGQCQQASWSAGICLTCNSTDVIQMTPEYAMQRLEELRQFRRYRDGLTDPRKVSCPECRTGGKQEQKYLANGGVRPEGIGTLAGQPRNLTGGFTERVKACKCQSDKKG